MKNLLNVKLLRDIRRAKMQFCALIVLCVLGTCLYSGIDGISKMIAFTNDVYFEQNHLPDLWISMEQVDYNALTTVTAMDGVDNVNTRYTVDMIADLPNAPTVSVLGVEGEMTINTPIIKSGEALKTTDLRGCLMQVGFAHAQELAVGDALTLKMGGQDYSFIVRGLIYSPEYIYVTNAVAPNPDMYGYIIINAAALPSIPLTQMVVTLAPKAQLSLVRDNIQASLKTAFIIDREAHQSTLLANDNVGMFAGISIVFPLAAYLVAALIVTTTLTRMIDNERMQIGTLRSLGFSKRKIKRHYLSYALVPSIFGSLLGVLLGHFVIPPYVWDILISQCEYPYRLAAPISPMAWVLVVFTVALSVFICLKTYRKTEKESTASLLRPKAPKEGKRTFFERTPMWKKLSFNGKTVVRNLLRNKLRTFISIVGLLCCNALIIASLGLQDSVQHTVNAHYEQVYAYTVRANLDRTAGDAQGYEDRLEANGVECVMEKSVNTTVNTTLHTVRITVLKDDQTLLHLGQNHALIPLENNGLAVTQKLAQTMGVKVGDTLECYLAGDKDAFSLPVAQIVYSNLEQGMYMTRTTWLNLRKGDVVPTGILLNNPTEQTMARLDAMDEVTSIEYTTQRKAEALVSLNMINSIFYVLMLIALALAFVICYNMGLINFSERTREYATLKVLGYHQKEIRKLILHENTIITAFAVVLSVVPGLMFTDVILRVCETDVLRYVPHVTLGSVLISCAVTWAFSVFIQRLLVRKVRSIVMVEALKSVE